MKRILLLVLAVTFSLPLGGCLVKESTYLKKVDETAALMKDLAALQEKHRELAADNSTLREQVEKLSGERADLLRDKEKLAVDNRELEKVLKAKSDTLSTTITQLRQKIADLENENARLAKEVLSLQKAKEEEVQKTSKTYEDLLDKMKNEIAQGQVTISELKGKLTVNMVDAILFDSGKAEVKPEGVAVLQKVVEILKTVRDKSIRIEGHTDNVQIVGALARRFSTNWELSAARAINVTRYLQDQGVDPANLAAVAYAEHRPVSDNASDAGRAKNRRIEIILVPRD
ncbi:OmpA family protein [Geobacter sp. DSM 9736]|uniref:OmpA family protein n=1 Tax=Geobacter sp. DSM 9736 TaxID=1277350 RepID=UPI000B50CB48|nr:OmpA family protein [Geobacter sp. DSM 9736]SNB46674.1 chemotaxis protein MotB [Geobacter sp. DSM 9736]